MTNAWKIQMQDQMKTDPAERGVRVSPIKYISQASVCLLGNRGESLQERRSEVEKGESGERHGAWRLQERLERKQSIA